MLKLFRKNDKKEIKNTAKATTKVEPQLSYDEWETNILRDANYTKKRSTDSSNYYAMDSWYNRVNLSRIEKGFKRLPVIPIAMTKNTRLIVVGASTEQDDNKVSVVIPRPEFIFRKYMLMHAANGNINDTTADGFFNIESRKTIGIDGNPLDNASEDAKAALNAKSSAIDESAIMFMLYAYGIINYPANSADNDRLDCICNFFFGCDTKGKVDKNACMLNKEDTAELKQFAPKVMEYIRRKYPQAVKDCNYTTYMICKKTCNPIKLGFGCVKDEPIIAKKTVNTSESGIIDDPAKAEAAKAKIVSNAEKFFSSVLKPYKKHEFHVIGELLELTITRDSGKTDTYTIDPGCMMGLGYAVMCNVENDILFVSLSGNRGVISKVLENKSYVLTNAEISEATKDMFADARIYQMIDMSYGWKVLADTSKPEDRKRLAFKLNAVMNLPWGTSNLPLTRLRFENWKGVDNFQLVSDNRCKSPFPGVGVNSTITVEAPGVKISIRKEEITYSYNGFSDTVSLAEITTNDIIF